MCEAFYVGKLQELNGTEQGTKSAFKIETREHAENLSL